VLERRGEEVSLHVMDSEQWNIARERQRFPEAHTNQQGADEARRIRDGDGADVVERRSASSMARSTTGTMLVRCAREAISGTTPPNTRWTSCDRITRDFWVMSSPSPSRTAAEVSSQDVSMPSMRVTTSRCAHQQSIDERARLGRIPVRADISFFLITPSLPTMNVSG